MLKNRIIPVLLLHDGGLTKTIKFKKHQYVGDPINAVRIFNEKEVDELIILDIDAAKENREPDYTQIADIVSEAFMPVAYGGGITLLNHAEKLFYLGIEKVVINSALLDNPGLLTQISERYGNQSVVASVDIKKNLFGKNTVYSHKHAKSTDKQITELIKQAINAGAGELIINSVDREGTYSGYDIKLLKEIAPLSSVPVIICGGASSKSDFEEAAIHGASAMAAGSMFVFQRPNQAVLISYLD